MTEDGYKTHKEHILEILEDSDRSITRKEIKERMMEEQTSNREPCISSKLKKLHESGEIIAEREKRGKRGQPYLYRGGLSGD